jgi:methylenetetrahydrofolate dehydrogenase (NADP+)/methenyltetrahydrofolate cyclohydrolase
MTARIIDGHAVAQEIEDAVQRELRELRADGAVPHLAVLQLGDDPAVELYVRNQARTCGRLGLRFAHHHLPAYAGEAAAAEELRALNEDPDVTGILLALPLPEGVSPKNLQALIHPDKDVEGVGPANVGSIGLRRPHLVPATAGGALELLRSTGVEARGREVTVVGASDIVGKPVALMMLDLYGTVTVCHKYTVDLAAQTRRAEILFVAAGVAGLVRREMVRPGAVVIDIGINRVTVPDEAGRLRARTVGDVDAEGVAEVASFLSPVPGGVGPATVAVLLRNVVKSARLQRRRG